MPNETTQDEQTTEEMLETVLENQELILEQLAEINERLTNMGLDR